MTKKTAHWYFDFISPYAYLQWQRLEQIRAFVHVEPVPILFAGLLNHHGQKGPAEIPAKRIHTFLFVQWLAKREGVEIKLPPAHPFNPLPALRLCLASNNSDAMIDAIFNQIWRRGEAVDSIEVLQNIARQFGITDLATSIAEPKIKQKLMQNTEAAVAANIFGVPTLDFGERQFWGFDATEMALDWLKHPEQFNESDIQQIINLPMSASRQ